MQDFFRAIICGVSTYKSIDFHRLYFLLACEGIAGKLKYFLKLDEPEKSPHSWKIHSTKTTW